MGECFRGKCKECIECFGLLNDEVNPNYIFNKQYKIYEDRNLFSPKHILKRGPHLMRKKIL